MDIKGLKSKWSSEKQQYKTQETGTGVHSFIIDCLESPELFHLKEGALSTKRERLKNEYIHEKKAKEKRRADFVIYINPDILIPVEAECYGNIEAGVKQLFNYQKDFEKHYGILTDGYTWRFYNNNIYRSFTLDQILNDPDRFVEYWKEYIKPETYYLSYFEPKGQLSLIKEDKLPVESNMELFFAHITQLIRSFKHKIDLEGYLGKDKEASKRATEITYAYIIQFILYKTIADNDFDDFKKEYTDSYQTIYRCLKSQQYGKILGIVDGISATISKNIYRPFSEEQNYITSKLLELIRKPQNELHDVSPWLDIFVFIGQYNFANVRYEIFGYIYENYLKELYEDENKGQYYTDPAIVSFMLKQIGYYGSCLKDNISEEKGLSLIDPACGSGTFLYSAVDSIVNAFTRQNEDASKAIEKIVNENIFGLDIAEFPLYLAEMSILMRMLPIIIGAKYNNPIDKKIKLFKTKDSISEFLDTAIRNTINDIDIEGGQQRLFSSSKLNLEYPSFVRDPSDIEDMKKSLENQPSCPRRRFDYVIGNPPYIGYNECSKQKILFFELMKQGKASLNNVYGVNLHSTPDAQKKYAPKPNLYTLFISLGIALLKDNGKLCYIIPQTILTAGDLDVIRYHLAKYTTIEKIITFSGKMFIGRGLKQDKPVTTSSLIIVVSRKTPSVLHKVEIINYNNPDDSIEETLQNILSGKNVDKKEVLQGKLFQNVTNWNFIKHNKTYLGFYEEYKRNTDDSSTYYEHYAAEKKYGSRFYFDGGGNILLNNVTNNKTNAYEIFDYKNNDYSRYTITTNGKEFYPKNAEITFPQGSQGINVFQQQYKIIWRTKDAPRFQFCDKDILLVSNQSLTISSNNKNETMYLLSLLNSSTNRLILKKNLLQEQEQAFLLPIKAIKGYIRVPKIGNFNKQVKDEIIKQTAELLTLEVSRLSDYIDFSSVMVQRFDKVSIEGNKIVLEKDKSKTKYTIRSNIEKVKKAISEEYGCDQLIDMEKKTITLSELKDLPVIDLGKQSKIKDYIDDLVFALYFNVPIKSLGLSKASNIKGACKNNKYYKLVSASKE